MEIVEDACVDAIGVDFTIAKPIRRIVAKS
jgi:hypothetical protein